MGQQQLLLLVLSTVIVGLATVAGIEAFQENQQQAQTDALVQRAVNIGNDVLAAHEEPSQFGGIDLVGNEPDASTVANAAGYESATPSAEGGGDRAKCEIVTNTNTATITCASPVGSSTTASGTSASGVESRVTVTVDPSNDPEVTTTTINGQSA